MSETELKPCRCGNTDIIIGNPYGDRWLVKCPSCGTALEGFPNYAEAIAAWNQYVDPAPAPQWTSEVPTEKGWYWVKFDRRSDVKVVQVYSHHDGTLMVDHCFSPNYIPAQKFAEYFQVHHWQPIPEPPLPAESEARNVVVAID